MSDRKFHCANIADLRTKIFYRRICELICESICENCERWRLTFSKIAYHIDLRNTAPR
jgi:hypothetical protein